MSYKFFKVLGIGLNDKNNSNKTKKKMKTAWIHRLIA